jgi:predicted enzyme related to lactoylglutathione lyase
VHARPRRSPAPLLTHRSTLDKAENLGGKTVMPPTEPMEGTTIALFADPEGHVVGLVKPGPPPEG